MGGGPAAERSLRSLRSFRRWSISWSRELLEVGRWSCSSSASLANRSLRIGGGPRGAGGSRWRRSRGASLADDSASAKAAARELTTFGSRIFLSFRSFLSFGLAASSPTFVASVIVSSVLEVPSSPSPPPDTGGSAVASSVTAESDSFASVLGIEVEEASTTSFFGDEGVAASSFAFFFSS